DRRKELVKQVHQRAEEARIAVRNCRRDALDHLRKAEKDGGISQEDERRAQERLQKLTDTFVKRVDDVSRQKETEVMEVCSEPWRLSRARSPSQHRARSHGPSLFPPTSASSWMAMAAGPIAAACRAWPATTPVPRTYGASRLLVPTRASRS